MRKPSSSLLLQKQSIRLPYRLRRNQDPPAGNAAKRAKQQHRLFPLCILPFLPMSCLLAMPLLLISKSQPLQPLDLPGITLDIRSGPGICRNRAKWLLHERLFSIAPRFRRILAFLQSVRSTHPSSFLLFISPMACLLHPHNNQTFPTLQMFSMLCNRIKNLVKFSIHPFLTLKTIR